MASIRRTLSPVPRPCMNGEPSTTASLLSKTSSSCNSNNQQSGNVLSSCLSSLNYACYRAQACLQRSSRAMEKTKSVKKTWRRSIVHFFLCFFLGAFTGLISIVSSNSSLYLFSPNQAFSIEIIKTVDRIQRDDSTARNVTSVIRNLSMNERVASRIPSYSFGNNSVDRNPNVSHHKFLIIVTPTYAGPLQAYYLNRLAHTLKLVPPPLLWIVVEMSSQSVEIAELVRNSGIMYRHLVCNKNLTDSRNNDVHLLNVALAHIERHHLDGITYFANDDNVYALDLFEQMRHIRRFGIWKIGKFVEPKSEVILDGPICNGSGVLGWHKNNVAKRFSRFHADMGGFAFNSTILWDPKRWHRPNVESIRLLDTVKNGDHVNSLIEQIVENESQMEGLPSNCSRIMVWHHELVQFKLNSAKNDSLQNGLVTLK